MIAAILRAQFLSMRLRVGSRRASVVFSAITGIVFYGFWTFLAFAAVMYFADPRNAANFIPTLSSGLLFAMLYWQFVPLFSAGFGASLDLRKLLVYPIPHRQLFTVEVLLRITNCAEMLILTVGAAIGLLRNPLYGLRAAPFVLSGALMFVATNILLSAGTRSMFERIFLRSRLKEALAFLFVIVGLLPQLLLLLNVRKAALFRFVPSQVFWPWAADARWMLREPVLRSGIVALLYLGAAWMFGLWQFERSIRYDPGSRARPHREARSDSLSERFFRFPSRLLADPIGALIEKELRTLARIPRFRMVYAMSCFFGIVIYMPTLRHPRPESFFMQNALPIMALYGLLMLGPITYWNCFGFDRTAVQGYFSWPVRFRSVLIAKNISVACLLIPQIVALALVVRVARMPASAAKFVETIAVILIASLYWFAVGNISSVRMSRPMDPDKMNQMANKIQALSIWSAPFLLLPIGLAYWARAVFGNELIFGGMLLIAAIVGAIFYRVGLDSAVTAAERGRETILMQLSRSDGPLSIT
jgi:ABC-2 type transport system permease protein